MTPKLNFVTTHVEVAETELYIQVRELIRCGSAALRVVIQSRNGIHGGCAYLERYDPQHGWHTACNIHPMAMSTMPSVLHQPEVMRQGSSWYAKDRAALLKQYEDLVAAPVVWDAEGA